MTHNNFLKISSQSDLPFSETNSNVIGYIFEILRTKFGLIKNSKQKLIDLGCGNGQVIIYSALHYGIKSVGIEINQDLIKEAKRRIKSVKKEKNHHLKGFKRIKIKHGDLFNLGLESFDFIYIFSFPTMQKYLRHIFLTIKTNSIIVSYKYPLNGFGDIMSLEYKLKNEYKNQSIITFFYKKL